MTDPLKNFLFIDQLKVMGYGESDTSGCWIKFQLTPELLEVVRGRKGEMVEVAARLIDNSGQVVPPTKHSESHGRFWADLIGNNVFNAPPVLEAIGTDAEFCEWVRHQPSCLSGNQDWVEEIGEGRCECAHVRRAYDAGTAIKPQYFAVPMTHEEHALQHSKGEHEALLVFRPTAAKDPEKSAIWFELNATRHRNEWASKTLAAYLGYKSRKDCPPDTVLEWASSRGLMRFFPERLRNAA